MIPDTKASSQAFNAGVQKGKRKSTPTKAPTGSAIPERKEYQNAFRRLPVA